MASLSKGQSKKLNVSKTAKHRLFAGLGWDPAAPPKLIDKVQALAKGVGIHHDLDLSCYLYNKNKALVDVISANPDHAVDASGRIYHSGDNKEGIGEGDDEEISVELKDLPETLHYLVFTAQISSGQTFEDINNPEIRLADGYTDHNLLTSMIEEPGCTGKNLFVFCCVYRDEIEDWKVLNIKEYLLLDDQQDPGRLCQNFIQPI